MNAENEEESLNTKSLPTAPCHFKDCTHSSSASPVAAGFRADIRHKSSRSSQFSSASPVEKLMKRGRVAAPDAEPIRQSISR
jgi:hypothetical protein